MFDSRGFYMAEKSAQELAKEKTKTAPVTGDESNARAKTEHLYRFGRVNADSSDDEDLTLQVAFSSEQPVLRKARKSEAELGIAKEGEKYWELLSHRKSDADFSDLNSGDAPVLLEHDGSKQVGNVKRAKLSKDKVGRAVLQFDGLSDLSKATYEQMKSGKRRGISFGYIHTKFIADEGEKDGYPIKRIAFSADEITSTFRPADTSRAGVRRSVEGQWSCLSCGEMFDRAKLDEDFECGCAAERSKVDAAKTRVTEEDEFRNRKAVKPDDFKFKRDAEDEISFNDLRQLVNAAVDSDKRFKSKRPNGDIVSCFYIADIILDQDEGTWCAIVVTLGPEYTTFCVEFDLNDGVVTLGEAEEVEAVTSYEPVERSAVDSEKLSRADQTRTQTQHKDFMADKTPEQIAAETTTRVRAELEPQIRTEVTEKVNKAQTERSGKIQKRNEELHAIADEFVKSRGMNWAGKPGEVVVVGERIRAFENEFCRMDDSRPDSEIRADFKAKCRELIDGSRPPKNQMEAAHLPGELASRVSLREVYNSAARSKAETTCFIPKDGAAYEAHTEIHSRAKDFPEGVESLGKGLILPLNMGSNVNAGLSRSRVEKLTRDALAGDFATAGALVAPDFRFPAIELLRNWPALSQAGMTLLSGVQGNLVLPRQTSATKSQSVAEGAALAQFDQTFDQIKMAPHRIGSSQKYTRLAMLQPGEDFEALVMADHMAQNALKLDEMGLNGQGANDEPLGILNQVGIGSVTFGGSAANAFKNALAMETAIRAANIRDEISYLTTSNGRGQLRSVARLLVGATTVAAEPVWQDNETINGRKATDSQQIPGDVLIAGAFRHLVCALWGGIAVVLDTITLADQDKYKLSMNLYVDFALRHAQAIVRSSDSIAALS